MSHIPIKQKIVRILFIILLLCTICSASRCQTITANFSNTPVEDVIMEIERQTKMSFIYKNDILGEIMPITASFHRERISNVLKCIFGEKMECLIQKKLIVLYPRSLHNSAKTSTDSIRVNNIRGLVVNANNIPMAGVFVMCHKQKCGTITTDNGIFTLNVPSGSILTFSFIGYETKDVNIGRHNFIRTTMKESQKGIDEVVVIGYGQNVKKNIIGAIDNIKGTEMANRPNATVTQVLQGKSPSVVVQQCNYNPNSLITNLNIRGVSTTNSNSPLIVIDGIVSSDNSLNNINLNDIENVSILKDAGAAAIYGSRSANGVILITTKKGTQGEQTSVKLNMLMGIQTPQLLYQPVPGYRNAEMRNLSLINSGLSAEFSTKSITDLKANQSQERWFLNQIFHTALQQNYNLSIEGSTRKTTYLVSFGYYGQQSNYVGNSDFGVERFNLRSNLNTEIGILKLQTLLSFSRSNNNSTTCTSLERDASRVPTYYYYSMKENGHYLLNDVLSEFNPLGSLEAGGINKQRGNDLTININASINLAKGLQLRGVFGANLNWQHTNIQHKTVAYYTAAADKEPARYDHTTRRSGDLNYNSSLLNSQLLLDYNRKFEHHSVNILLGVTNESSTNESNAITVIHSNADLGTSNGNDTYVKLGDGSWLTPERFSSSSITSLLGRIAYNYKERYYGEFDFRQDESSKFSKSTRWGFFPSLSAGWRISEEPFMAKYRQRVGNIKLRSSYGILGNQTIGAYDRFTTYTLYNYIYSFNNESVTGAGFSIGSNNLKWERTHTLNIGLDADFMGQRLAFTFDCFHKTTKDILMRPVTPSIFGTQQGMQNIGEMSNRGWEFSIRFHARTRQVNHHISANIGDTFNKLRKFPEGEQISKLEEMWILQRTGVSLSSYYGYKTDGYFKDEDEINSTAKPIGVSVKPGDLKFVDRNGDNIIDSNDRVILGNAFPRYTFGLTYNMQWRHFDFGLTINGVGKRDMMVRGELVEPFCSNFSYVIYTHQMDFWTEDNTNARYPRLTAPGSESNSNNYRMGSDIYIFNGAYARLKDITIGYTFPPHISSRLKMKKARVYLTGQNILTLSHNSFIDPESTEFDSRMACTGANIGIGYPRLKYFGMGLDIEF